MQAVSFEELSNGVLLVIDRVPTTRSAALGLFLRVGTRVEEPTEWGAAHFLEHLVFKGAGPWNGFALAQEMDRLGGDINAFTTRELTCYHAHVLERDVPAAFNLLWALARDPHLRAEDAAIERSVIREELREALDDPEDRVEQAFVEALWGPDPAAREVLGSPTSQSRLRSPALRRFWQRWYRPDTLAVIISGRLHPGTERVIRRRLAAWEGEGPPPPIPTPPAIQGGEVHTHLAGDRVQVMLGWPAPPWSDAAAWAVRLLAVAFGGQNSSRLWQRIREQEGLAYHVGATYSGQSDHGDFALNASLSPSHLTRVVGMMGEEWARLRTLPFTDDEILRARVQVETGLVFGVETPEGRMHWLSRVLFERRPPRSVADTVEAIRAVTRNQVQEAFEAFAALPRTALAAAAVGPRRSLPPSLRDLFTAAAPSVSARSGKTGVILS